jgi:hypothetical protein
MDRLGQFIDESCERVPDEKTLLKPLYAEYKKWALEKGWKPWADNTFGGHLRKAGFKVKHAKTGSQCEGLKLKPSASENTERSLQAMRKVIPITEGKKKLHGK